MSGNTIGDENPCTENYWCVRNIFVNFVAVLIIFINLTLIIVLRISPRCRRHRYNLIIVSLAVTDMLCGVIFPFNTLRIRRWGYFGSFGREMCSAVTSLVVILMSASVYNFVLVNLDRLLVFKLPFQQQADSSRKNIKIGIFCCWVFALLPAFPMWIPHGNHRTPENDGSNDTCRFPYESKFWVWWSTIFTFILPTIIILTIWTWIACHLYNYKCPGESGKERHRRNAKRITLIMGTITLAFLLCWWPYAVIFVRGTFMEGEEEKKTTGRLLYNMVIPAYLNSLINPLLYIALKEDVRDTLKNLILCRDLEMVRQSTRRTREKDLLPREREEKV